MIFVVDAANRSHFATDLAAMHRQRKAVFVDRAGWKLPVVADQEIDRYDLRPDTLYLLAKRAPDDSVLASVRLLTTTGPHLMCDLFRPTDLESMPRGASVWEASRFCTAPGIQARDQRQTLLWEVICGVMETGLVCGIDKIIFAASHALLPLALNCGWEARTLGRIPSTPPGHEVTAIVADLTTIGLCRVRRLHGIAAPVTQFPSFAPFGVRPSLNAQRTISRAITGRPTCLTPTDG